MNPAHLFASLMGGSMSAEDREKVTNDLVSKFGGDIDVTRTAIFRSSSYEFIGSAHTLAGKMAATCPSQLPEFADLLNRAANDIRQLAISIERRDRDAANAAAEASTVSGCR
ncbi:hypothetical protein [Lacipirellula sp.]|uniref:hypothetical protein n=1 Tax=Lacipirellula sp. TaxID=2691419 RepID=UPI003D0BE9A7